MDNVQSLRAARSGHAGALPSVRLRQKIATCARPSGFAAGASGATRAHYVDYLCHSHHIVRASIPLMELAIAHCQPQNSSHIALANYLGEHIREETGHAELLLQDLQLAGLDEKAVLARTPPAAVAQMVGAQYYWILHHSPMALLGYIAFLEGTPPTADGIAFWRAASGLGPDAFRSLVLHADADLAHRRELDDFLDQLDLGPSDLELIGMSAMLTAQCAATAWTGLTSRWSARS